MKRKNKKTAGVFLLAVILIFVVLPAVSVDAAERKGSITVQLNEIGTDREGTALECFYVAEQKENGWHLTEAFEGCKVTPWESVKIHRLQRSGRKTFFLGDGEETFGRNKDDRRRWKTRFSKHLNGA